MLECAFIKSLFSLKYCCWLHFCLIFPTGVNYLFQTIQEVQPDVVVVELCQYRVSMLKMDEKTLLKEAKEINLEKLQQAIKQVLFAQ